MKQRKRKIIGIALVCLTIIATLLNAVLGYMLPATLVEQVGTLTLNELPQLQEIILPHQVLTVANLVFIGLTLLYYLSGGITDTEQHVVYIEKESEEDDNQIDASAEHRAYTWESGQMERYYNQSNNNKERLSAILNHLCKDLEAGQGAIYLTDTDLDADQNQKATFQAGYAFTYTDNSRLEINAGDGLLGQCIKDGQEFNLATIPEGYLRILSGLGESSPTSLVILPIKNNEAVVGAIEIASFTPFTQHDIDFIKEQMSALGRLLGSNSLTPQS